MINHADTAGSALRDMSSCGGVVLHLQEDERRVLVKLLAALIGSPALSQIDSALDQGALIPDLQAVASTGPAPAVNPATAPKAPMGRPSSPLPSARTANATGKPTGRRIVGPEVRHVQLDDQPAVIIALTGAHGRGHTVTVDVDTWARVKKAGGDQWTRHLDTGGHWFVGLLGRASLKMPWMALGIAERGRRVVYQNGDYLDRRRCNLSLTD